MLRTYLLARKRARLMNLSVDPQTYTVGTPMSLDVIADGGVAPYNAVLLDGTLPPGLDVQGLTISGTPTQAGSYFPRLRISDQVCTNKLLDLTIIVQ